jgi:uncharacterized protein YqhQ
MMRGQAACATAVRAPDGTIRYDVRRLNDLRRRRIGRIPIVRGLYVLIDTLNLGFRSLSFSARVQAGPELGSEDLPVAGSMVAAVVFGVALFFLLPAGLAYLAEQLLGLPATVGNLLEGLIRLGLLLAYMASIARIPEIARVYAYHGAEHKTIHAFEANRPLTIDEIERFPCEHPRCGTAFLLSVVILSVLLFSLLGPMPIGLRLVSRILLIPVVAGLAYEYIRWTGRVQGRPWARLLVAPNLALQKLTTRPPEPAMIEVAIAAFTTMRRAEEESIAPPG